MKKTFFLIIILIILAMLSGWLFKLIFLGQSGNGQYKTFTIAEGQGVNVISHNLKQAGLIDNSFVFETYLWLKKSENKILAGEHALSDNWSLRQLVIALVSGNSIENERMIKIIEGWNMRDVAQYLEKEGVATSKEFQDVVGYPGVDYNYNKELSKPEDFSSDYSRLNDKPKNLSWEGYLFPDTYRIFKGAKVEDIARKMLNNFQKKITDQMMSDVKARKMSLFEIITLASIIEKEADTLENKKRVAGVYYNRLEKGMALQADPTVNYVTNKVTDRPSLDDIESDSPYNTYKYPGLPLGPICNPGLDSIMAAIYPEKNNYYFFINTPRGEMIFANTFEEHKANRLKYFND